MRHHSRVTESRVEKSDLFNSHSECEKYIFATPRCSQELACRNAEMWLSARAINDSTAASLVKIEIGRNRSGVYSFIYH